MSAIISDVKDDLQRLEELKRKIAEVKQELLSINGIENRTAFDKLNKTLQNTTREYNKLSTSVKKDMASVTASSMSMTKALGAIGGVAVLKGLASQMISVRAEFQKADTAIQTMLGSKEQADKLMAQVREYAKISPLEFGDITRATQMMLSFNIEAEKVPGFIKAIGDVSMGESGRFNSLTLAFSQMSATGKLMGQDLNQMINAGFNPLSTMAEKTGKSIGQLKEEMSKGAITAEMVQQAFIDATSAGGKFFGMSENAAKTIGGQISMLNNAMDAMYNELGTKSEGVILNSISALTTLVENYKKVAEVLASLVVSYGLYKTALILATEAEKGYTAAQTLSIKATILAEKAQKMLNATMLKNPYVIAAVALGTLVTTLIATRDTLTAAEHAQKNFSEAIEADKKIIQDDRDELEKHMNVIRDETETQGKRHDAYNALIALYPVLATKYKNEQELVENLTDAYKILNAEIAKKEGLQAQQRYDEAKQRAKDLRRMTELEGKQLTDSERRELQELGAKHHDFITDNGKTLLGYSTEKALAAAEAEYRLNVDANRQRQVSERSSKYSQMSKERAEQTKKALVEAKQKAKKDGKKYISINGEEAIDIGQVDKFIEVLDNNIKTIRKAGKDWDKTLKERKEKNKKEGKALLESTELITEEEYQKRLKQAKGLGYDPEKEAKANSAAAKKEETEARRRTEAQEKLADLVDKQKREQARKAADLELSTRDAEIKAMKDGTDKTIRQIEYDRDRELESIKRSYEDLKVARIEEAKKMYDADPKNKGKNFYESGLYKNTDWEATYTDAEKANRAALEKAAAAEAEKRLKEQRNQERQYLLDYIKEYGSIQQQKEAISKEYAARIEEAETEAQKGILRKQEEELQKSLAMKQLQEDLDWERVFGDLERYSTTALRKLKEDLRTALDAKDITVENAKILAEKINEVDDMITSRTDAWASLLPILRERKKLTEEAATAEQAYQKALSRQSDARSAVAGLRASAAGELIGAGKNATDLSVENIRKLMSEMNPASESFKRLSGIVEKLELSEADLAAATEEAARAQRAKNAIDNQLKNFNSFREAYKNGRDAAGGDIQWALQQASEMNDLIDAVGLHDTEFGEGVKEFTDGTSHFASAIQKFQTGDFVGAATDTIKGIQDYGHLVERIGGFSFSGSNADEVNRTTDRLTRANERLADRISDYTNAIGNSAGLKAIEASESALEAQKELQENNMEILRAQMGYHSAHHSNEYYADDDEITKLYKEAQKRLQKIDGIFGENSVKSLDDVYRIVSQDPTYLKTIKDYAPDLWEYLTTVGKYDKSEYWDKVVSQAGVVDEITEKINNNLTQTSFDSLRSNFLDTLTDMESSSEDFAKSFNDMMFKAMINSAVLDDEFNDWLKGWQADYAKAIEEKNTEALADLRKEAEKVRDEKIAQRDVLATSMNYTSNSSNADKSASALGLDKISYEQADQISGQLTAIQIAQNQIGAQMGLMQPDVSLLKATAETMAGAQINVRDIVSDIRTMMANSYLELVDINANTSAIVKPIKDMQLDIAEMKRDIKDVI